MSALMFSLVFTSLLVVASAVDLKEFRIPNAIPLALIALFLIRALATMNGADWPSHLAAFGIMLGLGFLAFALGLFGGGDAKLMTAVALWVGLAGLPAFLVVTAVAGGVVGVVLLVLRSIAARLFAAPDAGARQSPRLLDRRAPLPYALPITIAALLLEWR